MGQQWQRRRWRQRWLAVGSLGLGLMLTAPKAIAQAPGDLSPPPATAEAPRPATKPGTLSVEGEPVAVTLKLYSDPDIPLTTYYPESLSAAGGCSAAGCGIFFETTGTYRGIVQFYFPRDGMTVAEMAAAVTGPTGLIANQGWTVDGVDTDGPALAYPWVRALVRFHAPDYSLIGSVYIGEAEGRVFRATVVLPPEAGDGFVPMAHVILGNVQITPQAEPAAPE